jgi:3-methyl-2-oxobutanoate hydroxymethyltransferase
MARLLDEGGADALLVGDSLGMVVQGQPNTLSVTLEEMAYHGRMVARATKRAHVVVDMPFMSFQVSSEKALEAAGKLVKDGGAEAVKLEGGVSMAETVRRIVSAGIPVMGHVGLTPQSVHAFGGFRVQGKGEDAASRVLSDAKALEQAGAYAIVLEAMPADLARRITETVDVPTIGIGAGPYCDGQVLVCYDFLGMFRDVQPKFVRRFAELGNAVLLRRRRPKRRLPGGAAQLRHGRAQVPRRTHGRAPHRRGGPARVRPRRRKLSPVRAALLAIAIVGLAGAVFLVRSVIRTREQTAWAELAASAIAREHPAWEISRPSPTVIDVAFRGSRAEINLDNMRRDADGDEALFERHVLGAAESVAHVIDRASSDAGTPLRFESVRAQLYPVPVPRDFAHAQKLVTLPFAGEVLEAYVFDGKHHQEYVTEATFAGWAVDKSALRAAAVAALSSRIESETYSAKRPTDPSASGAFVALDVSDGYAAARILVADGRARLGKALGYPFFVGIPNRDFLVAWSDGYTFASDFAAKVRQDFARRSYPVSPEVFRVDEAGISLVTHGAD